VLFARRAEILALRPDFASFAGQPVGVVAPGDAEKDGSDANFEVRKFITTRSAEDPVTGSLNAGLGQWLIGSGIAPTRYIASQGTALGRAGRVHVEREGKEIWVGGNTVTCMEGKINV
jgi:predicted PhzF superfamily epimerase YddE/YHI9